MLPTGLSKFLGWIEHFARKASADRPEVSENATCQRKPSSNPLKRSWLRRRSSKDSGQLNGLTGGQPSSEDNATPRTDGHASSIHLPPTCSEAEISDPSGSDGPEDIFEVLISVRHAEDNIKRSKSMIAGIDTGSRAPNLMSERQWRRLDEDGRGNLEPFDAEVVPIHGQSVRVLGIAPDLTWTIQGGTKTFTSDFLITPMERHDVLIGREDIKKYRLLEPGRDLEKARKNKAASRDRFEQRKLEKRKLVEALEIIEERLVA